VPITATIRTNRTAALSAQIRARYVEVVDDTATGIRERASALSPRDTGSLAASWYTNNGDNSDYSQRAAAARSANDDATIMPEVAPEFALSLSGGGEAAYTVVVGSAVEHATYQEFGTTYQNGRPSLIPALEAFRDEFVSDMSRIADS
jgi:hypothetical protein